jgi:hypothetical protein
LAGGPAIDQGGEVEESGVTCGPKASGSIPLTWWLAGVGLAGLLVALVTSPSEARSAASQV